MKKTLILSVLFLAISSIGLSQSKKAAAKIEKKATELVAKLNAEITAGDETLGLSDDQKETVKSIQIERITKLRKLGKEASKEEKQKLNKAHFKKIFKEVLTKEQLKARKIGKSKK